jgi:hypothetical protein
VRARSLALVMLLALVAAVGFMVVRELTRPTPPRAVPPIELEVRHAPAPPSDHEADGDEGGDA